MYAERLILETDEHGFFKQETSLPPNSKIELIVLVLEKKLRPQRKPAAEVAGKAICFVDLTKTIIPEEDWESL